MTKTVIEKPKKTTKKVKKMVWVDVEIDPSKPKKKSKQADGKKFEKHFYDSIPDTNEFWKKREKDSGMGFKGDSNGFDMIITYKGYTFLLELKTHLDGFMPKGALRDYQVNYLNENGYKDNLITGFIFNFRDQEGNPTYFVDGKTVYEAIHEKGVSGFNQYFCECFGIHINSAIPPRKRTTYHYEIPQFLEEAITCQQKN